MKQLDLLPALTLVAALLAPSCASGGSQAPEGELERNLAEAEERWREDPTGETATIWYGRRLAYLGRYDEAVAVFGAGLAYHPDSYRLLRHRGHRWITLRRFDQAVADLTRAAELSEGAPDAIEPDGAPNEAGVPTSTSHANIWYHLGLALFLQGEFEEARAAYLRCLEFSRGTDDMLCATTQWAYVASRRLGLDAEAAALLEPIHADMLILENHAYHELLLMARGELSQADVLAGAEPGTIDFYSRAFGVAHFRLVNGDREGALELVDAILGGETSPAFGYIAAEVESRRLR